MLSEKVKLCLRASALMSLESKEPLEAFSCLLISIPYTYSHDFITLNRSNMLIMDQRPSTFPTSPT